MRSMVQFPHHAEVDCSRRDFLKMGALSPLLACAALETGQEAQAIQREVRRTMLPVIMIYMAGGLSQSESWNPPDANAPAEFRGPFRSIETSRRGCRFSEPWPETARHADMMAVIRNLYSDQSTHELAETRVVRTEGAPTLGMRWGVEAANDGPEYVMIPHISAYEAQYSSSMLYATYSGVTSEQRARLAQLRRQPRTECVNRELQMLQHAISVNGTVNPPLDPPHERLRERQDLLRAVDTSRISGPVVDRAMSNRERAFRLLLGSSRFQNAFHPLQIFPPQNAERPDQRELRRDCLRDLSEFEADLDRYGRNQDGNSLLLAKRLVQRGTGFVSVNHANRLNGMYRPTWDDHSVAADSMRFRAPTIDRAIGALLTDLRRNEFNAVVAIVTEFGRTPRMNDDAGRDHWQHAFSMLIAGGHVRPGVYGQTDQRSAYIRGNGLPVHEGAIIHTIMHAAAGGNQINRFLTPNLARAREALD